MITPDRLCQQYATIIPRIKQLGYSADIHGSTTAHCVMTISGSPIVHVNADGTWDRCDGVHGSGPDELLDTIRSQKADDICRHMESRNLKAMALDALHAKDIPARTVSNVRAKDGTLYCDMRKDNSDYTPTHIDDYEHVCRTWRLRLLTM